MGTMKKKRTLSKLPLQLPVDIYPASVPPEHGGFYWAYTTFGKYFAWHEAEYNELSDIWTMFVGDGPVPIEVEPDFWCNGLPEVR